MQMHIWYILNKITVWKQNGLNREKNILYFLILYNTLNFIIILTFIINSKVSIPEYDKIRLLENN
mgnify:CR=1 FL=1